MLTPATEIDLFEVWRRALSLVCGVYAAVVTGQSILRWTGYLSNDGDRLTRLAGRYVVVRLLSVRLRRYWPDVLQILALALLFAGMVWAHKWVEPHG